MIATFLEMPAGTDLGESAWHTVTQDEITGFARLTRDEDPFHIDPAWAAENSMLGTTIAFGFQTVSMLTVFLHEVFARNEIPVNESTQFFNFGFNRIRLPEPVPVGAEIRGRFTFSGIRARESGAMEIALDAMVEIRDVARPALVAEWLLVVTEASAR